MFIFTIYKDDQTYTSRDIMKWDLVSQNIEVYTTDKENDTLAKLMFLKRLNYQRSGPSLGFNLTSLKDIEKFLECIYCLFSTSTIEITKTKSFLSSEKVISKKDFLIEYEKCFK